MALPPNQHTPPVWRPTAIDPRDWGAQPGKGVDDTKAVLAAHVEAVRTGLPLYLPTGLNVSAPLVVNGVSGYRLFGDGPNRRSLSPAGQYGGPLVCIGMPTTYGDVGPEHRPANGTGAWGAPRFAAATLGKMALFAWSHPLNLGAVRNGRFDSWAGTDPFTVSFTAKLAPGTPDNSYVMGLAGPNGEARPFNILKVSDGLMLRWRCADRPAETQAITAQCDPTKPNAVTFQVDPGKGQARAWVNGKGQPVKPVRVAPLLPCDGTTPFGIGWCGPSVAFGAGQATDLTLYGLRVVRGLLNTWADAETPSGQPVAVIADMGGVDDPAGSPFVRVDSGAGTGLLWWTPPIQQANAEFVEVERVGLFGSSFSQAALTLGRHTVVQLRNMQATGGQGVGSIASGINYPLLADTCWFDGPDGGMSLYRTLVDGNRLQLKAGRVAARLIEGTACLRSTNVLGVRPFTEHAILCRGGDSGGVFEFRSMMVDNEGGEVSIAAVECEQGAQWGRLVVDGLDTGTLPAGSVLIRLVGHQGESPMYANPWTLDARNAGSLPSQVAVECVGKGWTGNVNGKPIDGSGADPVTPAGPTASTGVAP